MTAPKRYGGAEADFQTQCDVLAHLARGCPSTSWVATIFSAMSWLAATFPDQAQEEIFADRDPRISGVFSPTGTGVRKDGGLVVSGRWGFNTGCHGARWTVLNAVVGTGAEAVPDVRHRAEPGAHHRRRLVRHGDVRDRKQHDRRGQRLRSGSSLSAAAGHARGTPSRPAQCGQPILQLPAVARADGECRRHATRNGTGRTRRHSGRDCRAAESLTRSTRTRRRRRSPTFRWPTPP